MFSFLVGFQILMVLGCFVFVIIMTRQRENMLSKLMLCVGFFGAIQNAGYLLEMLSSNIGEAMTAVRVEFMGGAFMSTFLFIFVARYCGYNISARLEALMFSLDGLVLLCIWGCTTNERACRSVTLETPFSAATAKLAVLTDDHVPDFRARALIALEQLAVNEYPATDARTQRYEYAVAVFLSRAEFRFAERSRVGVVYDERALPRKLLHEFGKRNVVPAKVCPTDHATRPGVDCSRRADADRVDVFKPFSRFFRCRNAELCECSRRFLRGLFRGSFYRGFSAQYSVCEHGGFCGHSTEIDSDYHLKPLTDFYML